MKNIKKKSIVVVGDAATQLIEALAQYEQFKVNIFTSKSENFDACIVASWNERPKKLPKSAIFIGIDNPYLALTKNTSDDISNSIKKDIEALSGIWIPARAKFRRWGARMFDGSNISRAGWKALARESERAIERGLLVVQSKQPKIFLKTNGKDINLAELIKTQPSLSDKLALQTIERHPDIILANLPNSAQNYSAHTAIAILNNKIDFGVGLWKVVDYTPPIKWDMTSLDRSWHSYLLGLDFLLPPLIWWSQFADLNDANSQSMINNIRKNDVKINKLANDHELLEKSIGFIIKFIDDNPRQNPVHARVWHEGTTSRRLRTLLLAIGALSKLDQNYIKLPPGSVTKLLISIADHVDILSHDLNYRPSGNHGLRQDLLLYTCAKLFPKLPVAQQWAELARSRLLKQQLNIGVSNDGSWCEHSMSYQRLATNLIRKFCRIAKETDDETFMNEMSPYYRKMANFQNNLLRSNGTLPAIGDTGVNCIAPQLQIDEFTPQKNINLKTKDSDWFIAKGPKDFHAVFHADLRSPKHKHADDLSFVLFNNGQDWLIDPGALNRELGSDMRDHFCLDPAAHNSWTVNNEGYGFSKSKNFVGLDQHYDESEWSGASGMNERYNNGTVRRTMIKPKGKPILIIVDYVFSKVDKPVNWASHLHFASDISIKNCNTYYEASRKENSETLRIQYFSKEEEKEKIVCAQKDPLLGWVMSGWGEAEPSNVLVREFNSKKRILITILEFLKPEQNISCVSVNLKNNLTTIISFPNQDNHSLSLQVNGTTGTIDEL